MKTTLTKSFEKGFLHGLAGVSKRRSRKQVLQGIISEADQAIDMAKGLQGRGDWHGAATKVVNSAGLLDQAIDLAETLPGVNFERTRQQAQAVTDRLGKNMSLLDMDPIEARECVRTCETALAKAIEAVRIFTDRLNDDILCKDVENVDFDEDEIIKEIDKIALTGASGRGPGAARRQRIGQEAGVFQTGEGGAEGAWENVPGKAGRQRRMRGGKYEYRDVTTGTVAASIEGGDVKKDEEAEQEPQESEETNETPVTEKPEVEEEIVPEAAPEEKTIDPAVILQQAAVLGELGKAKKGKKVKPGSLKGGKSEPASGAKPGAGGRFEALVEELESKGLDGDALIDELCKKYAVRDPAALAATLGRAKYGKKRFQEMAAAGRKKAGKKKKSIDNSGEAIDKVRGQGRGIGGPRQGDGGTDTCVCSKCGEEVPHQRGTPCAQVTCPKCGGAMIGKSL